MTKITSSSEAIGAHRLSGVGPLEASAERKGLTGARFLSGFPVPVSPPDGVSAVGVPRAIRINPVGIKRVQAALPAG
jgi:hypothetical protein